MGFETDSVLKQGAIALHEAGAVRFGEFKLKSGRMSSFYIDLGRLRSFPEQRWQVAAVYEQMLRGMNYDALADVPTRPTPLIALVAHRMNLPQITPKIEAKDYGSGDRIVGVYEAGWRVPVLDDVRTTGTSLVEGATVLREESEKKEKALLVEDAYVLVDRSTGPEADLTLAKHNLRFNYAYLMPGLTEFLRVERRISVEEYDNTMKELGQAA